MAEQFDPRMQVIVTQHADYDTVSFYAKLGPTREDPIVYNSVYVSKIWPSHEVMLDHLWNRIKPELLKHYREQKDNTIEGQ